MMVARSVAQVVLLGLAFLGAGFPAGTGASTQVSINVDTWPSTTGDVSYGTTVILTCSVSRDDLTNFTATVEWDCPNGACSTSSGESIFIRRIFGNRLVVTVVNPGDEGLYNCMVTDGNGNMTGFGNYNLNTNGGVALHSLTSAGRAKFFIPSNSVLLDTDLLEESGGKYRIACRTAPGAAQWYFPDGSGVPSEGSSVYQLLHGNTGLAQLYISASSISNGSFTVGLYSCYAVGHTKGYIGLYLSDSAKLRSQPLLEDVEVTSGVITLRPDYLWEPSAWFIACSMKTDWGIPLPPFCIQGNQSVVLSGLDAVGTYEIDVRAVSGTGATDGMAKAVVLLRGDPLHLSVHETSSRNITVEWISSSSDIQFYRNFSGFDVAFNTINGRKLLTLNNLITFTTFYLSFKSCILESDCTNITLYLTTLIANPNSVSLTGLSDGTALLLSCSWSSVPSAVLYRVWWYLGAELISASTTEDSPASLSVFDDGIHCNYRVVVAGVDVFGRTGENSTAEVTLDIEKPFAPPTPQARALSDTEILVSWVPAVASCMRPVAFHQVRAAPSGTENYTNCLLNTTTGPPFQAVCVGLSRGSSYDVDVIALAPIGSTASSSVSVTTFDVPTIPHDLHALAVSDSIVDLTWQPPASDGGTPITHYIIEIVHVDTQLNFSTESTTLLVSNLRTGEHYEMSVTAVNTVGLSPSAHSSVTFNVHYCSFTAEPVSPTAVLVASHSCNGTQPSNFTLTYTDGCCEVMRYVGVHAMIQLDDLQPASDYILSISSGNGLFITTLHATTPACTGLGVQKAAETGPYVGGLVVMAMLLVVSNVITAVVTYGLAKRLKTQSEKSRNGQMSNEGSAVYESVEALHAQSVVGGDGNDVAMEMVKNPAYVTVSH